MFPGACADSNGDRQHISQARKLGQGRRVPPGINEGRIPVGPPENSRAFRMDPRSRGGDLERFPSWDARSHLQSKRTGPPHPQGHPSLLTCHADCHVPFVMSTSLSLGLSRARAASQRHPSRVLTSFPIAAWGRGRSRRTRTAERRGPRLPTPTSSGETWTTLACTYLLRSWPSSQPNPHILAQP